MVSNEMGPVPWLVMVGVMQQNEMIKKVTIKKRDLTISNII